MNAIVDITISPRSAVPSGDARVAWLETHGVPPESATVRIDAPLALWGRAGKRVHADGSVTLEHPASDPVHAALVTAALDVVRETGAAPESLPPSALEDVAIAREHAASVAAEESRQRDARHAAELAESLERSVTQALALPDTEWLVLDLDIPEAVKTASAIRIVRRDREAEFDADPRIVQRRESLIASLPVRREAILAQRAADAAGIQGLVALRGSPSQIERHTAGVLPLAELRDLARSAWLPALDLPLYRPMTRRDLPHDEDCGESGCKFVSRPFTGGPWSEAEWAVIRQIESAIAGTDATLATMFHEGSCSHCSAELSRYGVRVSVTRHGLTVLREYGLPEPAAVNDE